MNRPKLRFSPVALERLADAAGISHGLGYALLEWAFMKHWAETARKFRQPPDEVEPPPDDDESA